MPKLAHQTVMFYLKGGICGNRIPQTIWNFRRKIVWERKKYQDYTVCRANWRSFPLLMFSHCNKLSIKTLKHTIFSKNTFPQIFGNWIVDSADFFTFRMYVWRSGWRKTLWCRQYFSVVKHLFEDNIFDFGNWNNRYSQPILFSSLV